MPGKEQRYYRQQPRTNTQQMQRGQNNEVYSSTPFPPTTSQAQGAPLNNRHPYAIRGRTLNPTEDVTHEDVSAINPVVPRTPFRPRDSVRNTFLVEGNSSHSSSHRFSGSQTSSSGSQTSTESSHLETSDFRPASSYTSSYARTLAAELAGDLPMDIRRDLHVHLMNQLGNNPVSPDESIGVSPNSSNNSSDQVPRSTPDSSSEAAPDLMAE